MISVRYLGRIGNRLFTYAAARVLAERIGSRLYAPTVNGFPGTNDFVDGHDTRNPFVLYGPHDHIDMDALAAGPKQGIYIQSYLQRYDYFRHRAEDVRRWFRQKPVDSGDAVVVSVRLGDMARPPHNWAVGMSYYEEVLDTFHPGRPVLLMTDEPTHPALRRLDRFKPRLVIGSDLYQFRLLTSARHMVVGVSTFSWWAAFLSEGNVVAPLKETGDYFGPGTPNENYMVMEPRYTYITGVRRLCDE